MQNQCLPDLAAVAQEARVSPAAVSRVLRGDPSLRVAQATRDRILRAASKLNYVSDARASQLRQKTSPVLGVLTHGIWGTYRPRLLHHLTEGLNAMGKQFLFAAHHGDPALALSHVNTFRAYRTFAVLTIGEDGITPDVAAMIAESRAQCGPRIGVGFHEPPQGDVVVRVDLAAAYRRVLRLFAADGVGHVVLASKGATNFRAIAPIFRAAAEATAGVTCETLTAETTDSEVLAEAVAPVLLKRARRQRVGVVVGVDNEAAAIAGALLRAGVRIPHDVALVGYGGFEVAYYHRPPITTFKVLSLMPKMAERLAQILADVGRSNQSEPLQHDFEPELVFRETFNPATQTLLSSPPERKPQP